MLGLGICKGGRKDLRSFRSGDLGFRAYPSELRVPVVDKGVCFWGGSVKIQPPCCDILIPTLPTYIIYTAPSRDHDAGNRPYRVYRCMKVIHWVM